MWWGVQQFQRKLLSWKFGSDIMLFWQKIRQKKEEVKFWVSWTTHSTAWYFDITCSSFVVVYSKCIIFNYWSSKFAFSNKSFEYVRFSVFVIRFEAEKIRLLWKGTSSIQNVLKVTHFHLDFHDDNFFCAFHLHVPFMCPCFCHLFKKRNWDQEVEKMSSLIISHLIESPCKKILKLCAPLA